MIPEAAVEAGIAEVDRVLNREIGETGDIRLVRLILEAAAPFMLASAWEAGYLVAKEAIRQLDPINPYEAAK